MNDLICAKIVNDMFNNYTKRNGNPLFNQHVKFINQEKKWDHIILTASLFT